MEVRYGDKNIKMGYQSPSLLNISSNLKIFSLIKAIYFQIYFGTCDIRIGCEPPNKMVKTEDRKKKQNVRIL